jgi:hypothetical protein
MLVHLVLPLSLPPYGNRNSHFSLVTGARQFTKLNAMIDDWIPLAVALPQFVVHA